MNKVFDALASDARRQILAYLAREDELSAGEIAARFTMSKPAISKHLQLLENAGLVTSDKRGQFVWYALARDELTEAIKGFMRMLGTEVEATQTLPFPAMGKVASERETDGEASTGR